MAAKSEDLTETAEERAHFDALQASLDLARESLKNPRVREILSRPPKWTHPIRWEDFRVRYGL